jgi:plastocyanin
MALPTNLIDLERELIVKPRPPLPDPPPMKMDKKSAPSKPALTSEQSSLLEFRDKFDATHVLQQGEIALAINPALLQIKGFCFPVFKKPPAQALYLFLFHELTGQPGMCINGRTYLGNTPSVVGGTSTRMKFGVVGMGNAFHTFHLHGHRWIVPGPSGTTQGAIQGSTQNHAVSQFEDTRTFGPANSFSFFINGATGSFMRAGGKGPAESKGEWHLHCHVLQHMMDGMMGSLLIVDEGDSAFLPIGTDCGADTGGTTAQHVVTINNFVFSAPSSLPVKMGDTVRFSNIDASAPEGHGVQWLTAGSPANTDVFFNGQHRDITMTAVGTFHYQCIVHGASMPGVITVTM